ncbi:MAG: hypothetical protein ABSE73_07900 [Planctomycetota bacterium]
MADLSGNMLALGKMTAGLAHTINNPLSVSNGNSQFLNEDRPEVLLGFA